MKKQAVIIFAYAGFLPTFLKKETVYAYVTSSDKSTSERRLSFSTIDPANIHMSCAWQAKTPLKHAFKEWMQYIPFFLYFFRWPIEVFFYEQKTFWSLCFYMLRSKTGIELLVNLINISYCSIDFF